MNILIFIFCILYFILAFRRLDWAVMFLIMALPSYLIRSSVFGIPFTLLEAMILISFGTWFLGHTKFKDFIKGKYGWKDLKKNREKRTKYPFGIELILLLAISYIAVAVSGFSNSALGIWKAYFFEPALLFILVLNIFKEKGGVNKILWSLLISTVTVSVLAIYQKFTGAFIFNELWAAEETRRVTSFFGYPNAVGLYLGPIVLVLIGFLFSKIRSTKKQIFNFQFSIFKQLLIYKLQIFIAITILLSLFSIYFARSEGALVGVVAGLVVFGLLAGKKARWTTVGLVVLVAAGTMACVPTREYAIDKFLLRDLSGQFRKVQWSGTLDMLKDGRLVFGSGLANYKKEVRPYHQEGLFVKDYDDSDWHRKTVESAEFRDKVWQPLEVYLYPHNIFLNFWTELGVAGMLLFVWIIGKYFYLGMKLITNYELRITNNKFLIIGLIGAMIVIAIHGLVDVPYFKNDLAIMFWIFVAMISLTNLNFKNES